MNCLTFRRRGCGPEDDRSKAGKSKHGGYDAREYAINETGHLDSSHLANIGRFGRSYQHKSPRTFGASHSGTRTKSVGIRSRTETKLRGVQNNEVRTSSGAACIYL